MTFKDWRTYFVDNKDHFAWLDLSQIELLSSEEVATISNSIAQYQKGENSEGKNLIAYAQSFHNQDYLETIKDFIREEQRHAAVLGSFMKTQGIPTLRSHWIDSVFRGLRSLAGLENSVIVLLTAEIIAAVYYKALRDATGSPELKAICKRILIDEEMHINFQSFTLREHFTSKTPLQKSLIRLFHRTLMRGTILVVWSSHKSVLKAGGYTLIKFATEVLTEFKRSEDMITGKKDIELHFTPAK